MKYSSNYEFFKKKLDINQEIIEEYQNEACYVETQEELDGINEVIEETTRESKALICQYARLLFEELTELNAQIVEKGSGKTHTLEGMFGKSFDKLTLQKMQSLIDIFEGNSFLEFKY